MEVSSVNKGVGAIQNFFGSTKKMMENSSIVGGVIDLPKIYAAVPGDRIADFKRILLESRSKFTIVKENTQLSKCEINKLLDEYKMKDQIIEKYSKEFPGIKHIKESTADIINSINKQHGGTLTIKEIKALHNVIGKKLEVSNNKEDLHDFKMLKDVVDDLKHAQLVEKQTQAKEKVNENQLTKSNSMEMVQ